MVLDYIKYLFILVFKVTGCALASAFASLVGTPINFVSFVVGLKICVITARIKKSKSINKKKRKKRNKIVLLAKEVLSYKLSIEVLISKELIDPYISHHEFFFRE